MDRLSQLECVPCRGTEPSVSEEEIKQFKPQIPDWNIVEVDGEKRLERVYQFKDFSSALSFTNKVGAAAEAEDHHPAILTEWGRVTVTWWTHTIHGLHKNDFIMAAKTDEQYT